MSTGKKLSGAGLRGQVAGETALCTVGKTGSGLTYRGYDIEVLAEKAHFEEVAHLLLRGHLPTQIELDTYRSKLKSLRQLPRALTEVLENALLGLDVEPEFDVTADYDPVGEDLPAT